MSGFTNSNGLEFYKISWYWQVSQQRNATSGPKQKKRGSCKILTIKQRFEKLWSVDLWRSSEVRKTRNSSIKRSKLKMVFWALLGTAQSNLCFTIDLNMRSNPKPDSWDSTNLNAFIILPSPISCYFILPQEWYVEYKWKTMWSHLEWEVSCVLQS